MSIMIKTTGIYMLAGHSNWFAKTPYEIAERMIEENVDLVEMGVPREIAIKCDNSGDYQDVYDWVEDNAVELYTVTYKEDEYNV